MRIDITNRTIVTEPQQTIVSDKESCVRDCPIASKKEITFDYALWSRLTALARLEKEEWLALLTGDIDKLEVTGFYFPKQTRGSAHCEPLPGEFRPGTIGMCHSHHTMKAFFSQTDWANMNGKIEIVVNSAGEYEANVLVKLECGRWGRASAKVVITGAILQDQTELGAAIQKPAPIESVPVRWSGYDPYDWHSQQGQFLTSDREIIEGMNQPLDPPSNGNHVDVSRLTKRQRRKLLKEYIPAL